MTDQAAHTIALEARLAQTAAERDSALDRLRDILRHSTEVVEAATREVGRQMGVTTAGVKLVPRWVCDEVGYLASRDEDYERRRRRHIDRVAIPPEQVEPLVAYYLRQKVTVADVARAFHVSQGTVRAVLHTAGVQPFRGKRVDPTGAGPAGGEPAPDALDHLLAELRPGEGGELRVEDAQEAVSTKIRVGLKARRLGWRVHWQAGSDPLTLRFAVTVRAARPPLPARPKLLPEGPARKVADYPHPADRGVAR